MYIKSLLIELLSQFGYPIYLQGSMSMTEAYPKTFFTIFNNSTDGFSHYDNRSTKTVWNFDVNLYSSDPMTVNEKMIDVINLLKENKFIIDGKGYDVASDEPTHTGRGITVLYVESEV